MGKVVAMPEQNDQLSGADSEAAEVEPAKRIIRRRARETAEATPQRFDPAQMRGRMIEAEHLARYRFAAGAAAGRTVLDAGCGWAYGADILARAGASQVVGIDISETVVEAARHRVDATVTLEVADLIDLPFESDSFDMVVCFETIEHLREQGRALDEIARVLSEDGLLFISSPNDEIYGDRNPHHFHQYTRAELWDELFRRFGFVEIYAQQDWVMSMISTTDTLEADDLDLTGLSTLKSTGLAAGRETFMVGVASNVPICPLEQQAVLSVHTEIKDWLERWEAQDRYLRDLRSELQKASTGRLLPIEQRFLDSRLELADADRRVAKAEHEVALMQSSWSWRVTAPLRGNRFLRAIFRRGR